MNRLFPILGLFVTLGATAATVVLSDTYLAGNFSRQLAVLERERPALKLPTANGPPAMSSAAEVWLFPGEALVNLSTIKALALPSHNTQVRLTRRTWKAERHSLDATDSAAPENSRFMRHRVWNSPVNRDLAIASTWLSGRMPWADGPTQVRILAHRDVTWSQVSDIHRRASDVALPRVALGVDSPNTNTISEWSMVQGTCDAVTLHLTNTAVRRTERWNEHMATWETCAEDGCSAAIATLIGMNDGPQSYPSDLCLRPYDDVPISKVADALGALYALDTTAVLNVK